MYSSEFYWDFFFRGVERVGVNQEPRAVGGLVGVKAPEREVPSGRGSKGHVTSVGKCVQLLEV